MSSTGVRNTKVTICQEIFGEIFPDPIDVTPKLGII